MKYLKIEWLHTFDDEPRVIYSEIDAEGYETRKVETFADSSFCFASEDESSGDTLLSELPVPDLDTLESDEEFVPQEIDKLEFERVWALARGEQKAPTLWGRIVRYIQNLFNK
jgi:hypothetical protein